MKRQYIIANWKSNKTEVETRSWFAKISNNVNKEIIICPAFTVLSWAKKLIDQYSLPFKLGAQNISPFDEGSYTGEINGRQIQEFAQYVIIGHSERRRYFHEDEEILEKKVKMALSAGLIPIFCVEDSKASIPGGVTIVAYEPTLAIGTGNPDTPQNANATAKDIKDKSPGVRYVLYGGSVTAKNVNEFTRLPNLDGVLVGGASLNPSEFFEIIINA